MLIKFHENRQHLFIYSAQLFHIVCTKTLVLFTMAYPWFMPSSLSHYTWYEEYPYALPR